MASPSMPVYILPGSTLKQETIENLFNTFRTTSAIDGVPPASLAFHTVPAATHQCSSPAQIADYHAQNKQEGVSLEPVIVLDGQSEGDGTALIVGFPREDEDEEPAPTNTEAQAQSYPSIRVVSAWMNPLVANLSIGHQDLDLYIQYATDGVFRGFPT